MKKWSNKKAEWLLVMLAVSLTASASWTITAEEKSEAIDRYIIVELETLTAPNVDAEEMELSSESEQSTEETVEVESEPEVVLFSLQDSLDSEEYIVTGISVDEPIIAQLLEQTADYQNYDTIALYDITSYQQTTDEPYDFNLQIPEDADITLYQTVDGQLQESTLDVMCTEDEYNRLPLVSQILKKKKIQKHRRLSRLYRLRLLRQQAHQRQARVRQRQPKYLKHSRRQQHIHMHGFQ